MKRPGSVAVVITSVLLAVLALWGGYVAFKGNSSLYIEGDDPSAPTLDLYTSGGVTTPHIALFAAIRNGDTRGIFNFRIHLWKNPDDLLSNVVAGNGDLWVGHTEGFAVARLRGAPVMMYLFTSFNKFYILTSESIGGLSDLRGEIAFAPPGSPARAMFEKILNMQIAGIRPVPYQGRELGLLLASGRVKCAVIPEPLVSLALAKNSGLHVAGNIEDLFCRSAGIDGPVPVAGIAVNEKTAKRYRDRFAALQRAIIERSRVIEHEGRGAARYIPDYCRGDIPGVIAAESLLRDRVSARAAYDLKSELGAYLNTVYPELFPGEKYSEWSETFLWRE